MPPINMKLVTIITDVFARERVSSALSSFGARGCTVYNVEGHGVHGDRVGGLFETKNAMFLVVASAAVTAKLLDWVEKELVPTTPSIAYATDVMAVPGDHF